MGAQGLLLPIQVQGSSSAGQRFPPHNRTLEVGEFRVGGGVHDTVDSYTFQNPVLTGGIFTFPAHSHRVYDRHQIDS